MMRHPFVLASLGLFAVFLLLHLTGGRQYVGVLSGTVVGGSWGAGFGLLYVLAWFGAVLAAPVLLLAGLLDSAFARASRAKP
ncbi:hypothetical protein [Corallococcus terminator]|uniref:Uncharacterized protein n=1 Tax=Corallococcus terminator TaxID=2316733 RepID=A0A3A8J2Q6_9BACT|nr:hypothetical protein [Corallococcus terminator]RKG86260.1 hypothetical protein D7V88_18285 [Corallococcus terminator]